LGALIHGGILPAFALLFGEVLNQLSIADKDELFESIQSLAPYFVLAGAVAWVATYVQAAFFQVTAQRQSTKIRDEYLRAMFRQEVGWFDKIGTGALITRISGDTNLIKEGFG